MVARRAVVVVDGRPVALPAGDTLAGVPSGGGGSLPSSLSVTYGAQGAVETITVDGVVSEVNYNAQGRVSTVVSAGRTETYTYDASGRFTGMVAS